jgi:hypothetical protein
MGGSVSRPNNQTKQYMSSEQIKDSIKNMFRMYQSDNTVFSDTIGFRDVDEQKGGKKRFMPKVNRYAEFAPENILASRQLGGNTLLNYGSTGSPISSDIPSDLSEIQAFKQMVQKQKQADGTTQDGGACPCNDDKNFDKGSDYLSITSQQPIDYSVLKGGAKPDKKEDDKKDDKKNKKKKSEDEDHDDEDDEDDEDEEDEEDDEEEEEYDDDDVDDDDDEDGSEASRATTESSSSDENNKKSMRTNKRQKNSDYAETSQSSDVRSELAVPFYSSETADEYFKKLGNKNVFN